MKRSDDAMTTMLLRPSKSFMNRLVNMAMGKTTLNFIYELYDIIYIQYLSNLCSFEDMYKSAVDEGVYANGVRPPVERADSNYARSFVL